jgi:hypothetical protein
VRGRPILTAELVGGVLLGSELWWVILCGGAHALRRHFDFHKLTTMNRATGIFVMGVGVVYIFLGSEKPREGARPTALLSETVATATRLSPV